MSSLSKPPSLPSIETAARSEPAIYEVVVVRGEKGLADHAAAWDDLAQNLAEPNAHYEPWALLPAIRQFGKGLDLRFVFVYLPSNASQPEPLLCGFFPLQHRRLLRHVPVSVLEPWQHLYCYLCTPLLREGHATPVLESFFDWLSLDSLGSPLLQLNLVSGDGAFVKALTDVCYRRRRPMHLVESYCRALIEPRTDAQSYMRAAVRGRNLKGYRRKERNLGTLGKLERRALVPGEDAAEWAEMFLQLEARGWKGRQGTAMLCRLADATYFREMVLGASAAGKLMMSGLFLDGKPLALQCNLRSGAGSFAFKIAFDEDYASSSPGTLLELANIELVHTSGLRWMDSCAVPEHPVLSRLWMERRLIIHQFVATGRAPGDWIVSMMPLARWVKRLVRPSGLGRPRLWRRAILTRPPAAVIPDERSEQLPRSEGHGR